MQFAFFVFHIFIRGVMFLKLPFPIKLRCTSLALIYQITASIAAGLAPLIMLYIVNHTANHTSPVYFLIISIAFCLAGLRLLGNEKEIEMSDKTHK